MVVVTVVILTKGVVGMRTGLLGKSKYYLNVRNCVRHQGL